MGQYNKKYRENPDAWKKEPFTVKELPYEKLNRHKKGVIKMVSRYYRYHDIETLFYELDRLQFCNMETAIRVAEEAGELPEETIQELKNMEEIIMKSTLTHEDNLRMIEMYNAGVIRDDIGKAFGLNADQIYKRLWYLKKQEKYKDLFKAVPETKAEQNTPTAETETPTTEPDTPTEEKTETVEEAETAEDQTAEEPTKNNTEPDPEEPEQIEDTTQPKEVRLLKLSGKGKLLATGAGMVLIDGNDAAKRLTDELRRHIGNSFYAEIEITVRKAEQKDVFVCEVEE